MTGARDVSSREQKRHLRMSHLLPELTVEGLVLWRVRRAASDERWCTVTDFRGELGLMVYDPVTDETPVAEAHVDVVSAVRRADTLRRAMVATGWHEVDADPDDPDDAG